MALDEDRICSDCGSPIPPGSPGGACPGCLLAAGLPDDDLAGLPTRAELTAAFPALEIGELIGRGGMGAVFAARQRSLDRPVALKVLPVQDPATARAFADRFGREARTLAKLDHPHIVRIHEFGESGGLYYLLMEQVDGVNLREAMEDGRMTPRQALAVIPQICDALQYAHDNGVVHRDIKPENVLMTRAGVVKVVDFGLAKLVTPTGAQDTTLTRAGQVMGTVHYMAPEQIESPSSVDHRADIYSLGVVFYEMLTGDLPLGRFGAPSERVDVDARLDEVVLRALEKKRERRYQRADDVKTAVSEIGDPGEGGPRLPRTKPRLAAARAPKPPAPMPVPTPQPPGSRKYSGRAVMAFLLVPLAALLGVWVGVSQRHDMGRAFGWVMFWSCGCLSIALFLAIASLGATGKSGKKGRWMAVFTIVFSLIGAPALLFSLYYLLVVSAGSRARHDEQVQASRKFAELQSRRQQPPGRAFPPGLSQYQRYPVHDDPEFVVTAEGTMPIPAALAAALKSRLNHLLGAAAPLAKSADLEIAPAAHLVPRSAMQTVGALSPEELREGAAVGAFGLAFLAADCLPEPLDAFRVTGAHIAVSPNSRTTIAKCSGIAKARSDEYELTFEFEADRGDVFLSVKPIGWTRIPADPKGRAKGRPPVRVIDENGVEMPRVGGPKRPTRAIVLLWDQFLSRHLRYGTIGRDEQVGFLAPSDAAEVATLGYPALLAAQKRMELGLPLHFPSRETRLARANIDEIEFTDETHEHAIVRASSDDDEFVFPVRFEGGEWRFAIGRIVVKFGKDMK